MFRLEREGFKLQGFRPRLITSNQAQQLHLNPLLTLAARPVRMWLIAQPKTPFKGVNPVTILTIQKEQPSHKGGRKINHIPWLPHRRWVHSRPFGGPTGSDFSKPLLYHLVYSSFLNGSS